MSNFISNTYGDLNGLTNINADEVRTSKLYVDDILIMPNSVNMNNINCQTLTCQTDISSNKLYATTSIQGVPVVKFGFLDATSSIQTQFNTLISNASTYLTTTSAASMYATIANLLIANTNITAIQNRLIGLSYDTASAFSNFANNAHVYGSLYIGDGSTLTNVNTVLSSLPTTYVNLLGPNTIAGNTFFTGYTQIASCAMNSIYGINYFNATNITNPGSFLINNNMIAIGVIIGLQTALDAKASAASLSSYVLTSVLNSTLANYATVASLGTYITSSSLATSLLSYASLAGNNVFTATNYFTGNTYISGYFNCSTITNPLNFVIHDAIINTSVIIGLDGNLSGIHNDLGSQSTRIKNAQTSADAAQSTADAASAAAAVADTSAVAAGAAITGLVATTTAHTAEIGILGAEIGAVQTTVDTISIKTSLMNTDLNYTKFSGSGIKIMDLINPLSYNIKLSSDGTADFYGKLTCHAGGLDVVGGINTDTISCATSLISNGTLLVVGETTMANISSSGSINCNTYGFSNTVGVMQNMTIGANGNTILGMPPSTITIGNMYSTTILNGVILFNGTTLNFGSGWINQLV